jgi:hypothetical protein
MNVETGQVSSAVISMAYDLEIPTLNLGTETDYSVLNNLVVLRAVSGSPIWKMLPLVSVCLYTAPPLRSTRHDTGTAGAGG